jgi:GNAT superfamily N-acetyltransferase
MNTIRRLYAHELKHYSDHLCRLNADDRYLRFGCQQTDDAILNHVNTKDGIQRLVLAAFDEYHNVVAACEIAFLGDAHSFFAERAEIGLSVEEGHRGKGLGTELFERAMVVCRNRRVKILMSYCLTRNGFMMKIAKTHNMKIVSECGASEATLQLDEADILTYFMEMVGESMALADEYNSIIRKTIFK